MWVRTYEGHLIELNSGASIEIKTRIPGTATVVLNTVEGGEKPLTDRLTTEQSADVVNRLGQELQALDLAGVAKAALPAA